MRGKAWSDKGRMPWNRITPAYAGKRFYFVGWDSNGLGSPPPMRGKAVFHLVKIWNVGITPAYAGKRRKVSLVSEM